MGTKPPGFPPDHDTAVPVSVLPEKPVKSELVPFRAVCAMVGARIGGALGDVGGKRHSEEVEAMSRYRRWFSNSPVPFYTVMA